MDEDEWTDYEDGVCYPPQHDYQEDWLQQQQSEDENEA